MKEMMCNNEIELQRAERGGGESGGGVVACNGLVKGISKTPSAGFLGFLRVSRVFIAWFCFR